MKILCKVDLDKGLNALGKFTQTLKDNEVLEYAFETVPAGTKIYLYGDKVNVGDYVLIELSDDMKCMDRPE